MEDKGKKFEWLKKTSNYIMYNNDITNSKFYR